MELDISSFVFFRGWDDGWNTLFDWLMEMVVGTVGTHYFVWFRVVQCHKLSHFVGDTRKTIILFAGSWIRSKGFFESFVQVVGTPRVASKLAGYTLRYANIAMEKRTLQSLKMYFLWKIGMFHCFVSLPEGNSLFAIERHISVMVLFSEG